MDCPYKGLAAFGEEDAALFFGRQRESRIVTSNLRTARLSVLYAPSGVGKSSLIRAGVAHPLREGGAQPVVVFDTWSGDPAVALKQAVAAELQRFGVAFDPEFINFDLDEFALRAGATLEQPLLLILDQVEDYLLYGPTGDAANRFEEQLARTINRRDCPVRTLIVIREDALARLDRLSGRIPTLFNNRLRIRPLDRAAATDAIVGPLAVYNRENPDPSPVTIDNELVEQLVLEVRAGQQLAVQTGREEKPHAPDSALAADHLQVEAPYLQLILTKLWDIEMQSGSRRLRAETLTALGGAQRILKTHLDSQMRKLGPDQREVAARIFRFLVTPSGTSNAFSAADLADYGEVPLNEVEPVLRRLAAGDVRILRYVSPGTPGSAPRYEVFFEVMAAAALSWRSRFIALPMFSWRAWGLPAVLLLVAILAEVVLRESTDGLRYLLGVTRGAVLLVLTILMLVQIYRWFLRFVSMTGFLSIGTYRSPLIGIVLGVLLTLFWYVETNLKHAIRWDGSWPAIISTDDLLIYLPTVLLSWAVGAFVFAIMQFAGQVTARRFRSFDIGLYGVFAVFSALLLIIVVLLALWPEPRRLISLG